MYPSGSKFVNSKLHSAVMKKLFSCLEINGIHVEAGKTKLAQKTRAAVEVGKKKVAKFSILCSVCMIRYYVIGSCIHHQKHLCDTTCN